MPAIKELIRSESNGSISFGDFELSEKKKLSDFDHEGDLYKVKTYNEITKLERNGMFVYESVPGTTATDFQITNTGAIFSVEGIEDAQITLGLEENTEYEVLVDDQSIGSMKTNMSGKLVLSVELEPSKVVKVEVKKK